uniref:(California timema) hypothetical protein n=1 Tax=Timema californicum TaxID=61474 RepID=A0A7R9J165_TIMCA|nr:unnamed protein product [Timema californicum]
MYKFEMPSWHNNYEPNLFVEYFISSNNNNNNHQYIQLENDGFQHISELRIETTASNKSLALDGRGECSYTQCVGLGLDVRVPTSRQDFLLDVPDLKVDFLHLAKDIRIFFESFCHQPWQFVSPGTTLLVEGNRKLSSVCPANLLDAISDLFLEDILLDFPENVSIGFAFISSDHYYTNTINDACCFSGRPEDLAIPTFLNMFPPQSPTTLTTLTPFKASVKEEKSNKEKLLISMCDPQKGGGQPTCQGPPQQRLAKRPGPGRPPGGCGKRKPEKKCGRLWEFIRDLLLNQEYCPSLICWEDYEQGMFRFVHSEGVAKLWGTIKENPRMNYEKLSRAMRYYYKSKVLQPVLGRRLVYKFGPTAKGWRTPNPNFKNPE